MCGAPRLPPYGGIRLQGSNMVLPLGRAKRCRLQPYKQGSLVLSNFLPEKRKKKESDFSHLKTEVLKKDIPSLLITLGIHGSQMARYQASFRTQPSLRNGCVMLLNPSSCK